MKDATKTTYNMLQACLEMLTKLTQDRNSNLGADDRIGGDFHYFTREQIENHLISQGGLTKNHIVRIEVEVHAMNQREAIIDAVDQFNFSAITEVEHSDNRFGDSQYITLSDMGIPNIEFGNNQNEN